jgi:succinate dehydrogenase / fumarate reductase membrane anchor subunit
MSFLTDYKRVAGLGSAKTGTEHFVEQRLSAIALIPLSLLFLYTFIPALGAGYEAVLAIYARPIPALIAIMFIWAMFSHLRMGLQVVIEDYIPNHRVQMRLLIINALLWRAAAIAGVFAVAKLAFTA